VWIHKLGFVCDDCYKLEARCSICHLPAREGFARTSDGRIICARDLPNAVLKEEEGIRVFGETRGEVARLLGSALDLKTPEVSVKMFDVDYWSHGESGSKGDPMHRTGFSKSSKSGGKFVHNVILLSGQLKIDLVCICAHESMHLWVHENCAESRQLEGDSHEAICELLAFKLMAARGDTAQQEKLRQNPYTNGKINTLIDLDARFGFGAILDWVKSGTNAALSAEALGQFKSASAFNVLQNTARMVAVPEKLELNGISKAGKRRLAVISGVTFEKGEEAAIKLKDKSAKVRCLEILDKAVVIQVEGANDPITLTLDGN
jgi:hypothetical protein